jgi:hypothetical protein
VSVEQLNEALKAAFPFSQVRVWPSRVAFKALEVVKTEI